MKKILFFLSILLLIMGCEEKDTTECMNVPPSLGIVIVKNEVENDLYTRDYKLFKKDASLYKLVENKKTYIEALDVYNENIFIFSGGKELKTFFTQNIETFYVEYKGNTDTLQIKGNYYENENCGDTSALTDIYFNGKEIELKTVGGGIIYKIDNTK